MSKYLKTAAQANDKIRQLLDLVPEENLQDAAVLAGEIYNLGIRTAPRATHSTVRFNAVSAALEDLGVDVSMDNVTDEKTGKIFNALSITPK